MPDELLQDLWLHYADDVALSTITIQPRRVTAYGGIADVDVTTDGGSTWESVWHRLAVDVPGPAFADLPLPTAAHQSAAQVRFRLTGPFPGWWQVDNVFFGNRTCDPVAVARTRTSRPALRRVGVRRPTSPAHTPIVHNDDTA